MENMFETFGHLSIATVLLIIGILGIFVMLLDHITKKWIRRQELALMRERFELEKKEIEARRNLLYTQVSRITQVGSDLAIKIAEELKRDVKWMVESLETAKLWPRTQSLFAERLSHFRDEKESIADEFTELLIARCKYYTELGMNIYLLIDSGTTIFPIFERLGRRSVELFKNDVKWLENISIATNNLPGIQSLIETGRTDPTNRYSPLAIKCNLLPGAPLPVYSAVTGDETNEAIKRIKSKAGSPSCFIGLVTGNWIRLGSKDNQSKIPFPIPLARGEGHKIFKEIIIENSDEIFIISPLGKIFVNDDLNIINEALELSSTAISQEYKPYEEVTIEEHKLRKVKLISTSRESNRVLGRLSGRITGKLNVDSNMSRDDLEKIFSTATSEQLPHFQFPFDKFPNNWFLEADQEFPHPKTRTNSFQQKYFFVPKEPIR